MSSRSAVIVGVVLATVVLGLSKVSAAPVVTFTVGFGFKAGEKQLPPGTYTMRTVGDALQFETLESATGKARAEVIVKTRLGEDPIPEPNLVFDVADGKYYLSEVQIPHEDGYLVGWAPGPHTHKIVHPNPAK